MKPYLLLSTGCLLPSASPSDVSGKDPIFILKNPSKPNHARDLVFRQSDNFTLKILGLTNPLLGIDKNAGVPEKP